MHHHSVDPLEPAGKRARLPVMAHDPDRDLLRAWQAGDKQAGNTLFKRHIRSIQRFFRNKVPFAEEDELIQETFLGCVKNVASFRGEASFRTYLFKVARNRLSDHLRQRSRQPEVVDLEEISVADLTPGFSTVQARKREQVLLLEALRAIPLKDQIVLEYAYWEELTAVEIGEILDLPEPAVRSRLRRAKEKLESQLERRSNSRTELTSVLDGIEQWAEEIRERMGRKCLDDDRDGEPDVPPLDDEPGSL